ncbi:MAG: helix-turn-helix transcriptional regulator [Clostridia bacterium]|nr:helix-turn-helix transcriptional regulator [Clostridia bacterium]
MKQALFQSKKKDFEIMPTNALSPTPHFHNQIELVYVISGQTVAFADQKKIVTKAGELFVAFPNQIHYYEKTVIGRYIVIIFSPELIYGMEDILYNNIPKLNLLSESKMRDFANIILNIVNAGGDFSHTVRVGLMNQLLAGILPEFELMPRIKTNNTTLQSVLNYCTKNFSNDLTLDILAEDLHISKFHISHLLNQKLGISFSAYLNNIRVHKACSLLNNSQNKISDISEEVGFGSIRSFNRAFKSVMNMTPIEYRNQI